MIPGRKGKVMAMGKPNNVIRIPTSIGGKFFRYWLDFLKPFHHLTDREEDIVTCFLRHRYELGKVIKDDAVLDKVTMSDDTRRKVREECGVTLAHFQVIMGKLRKNKVIVDGKLNPRFIPNVTEEKGVFRLVLYFDLE